MEMSLKTNDVGETNITDPRTFQNFEIDIPAPQVIKDIVLKHLLLTTNGWFFTDRFLEYFQ